eukprot:TRINITY_DN12616_c0_g2_i1.p2 TRINITY_DN12616_c0_g2~~TRINITY_DN12616_c0_g2_i1.p2  ORF type:complete len:146 (+),score=19.75 TRINITY_DN12616_c0_g2_i1:83-520(+)
MPSLVGSEMCIRDRYYRPTSFLGARQKNQGCTVTTQSNKRMCVRRAEDITFFFTSGETKCNENKRKCSLTTYVNNESTKGCPSSLTNSRDCREAHDHLGGHGIFHIWSQRQARQCKHIESFLQSSPLPTKGGTASTLREQETPKT